MIVGGHGPRRTPRLAARYADEYNIPFESPGRTGFLYEQGRRACIELGRDPADLVRSHVIVLCCGRDQHELDRRASRIGRPIDDLIDHAATGLPEQVQVRLSEYAEQGAQRCYLQVRDFEDLDHHGLVAQEVLIQASGLDGFLLETLPDPGCPEDTSNRLG
jgi:alkanesulfonate monooxygenase SsuD/methylene tetrahydromethanopterin reductase-like flavin-dependent oxidoreductase (luciferase family)